MSKIVVRYTALCIALFFCSYGSAQIPVTYLGINQGLSNNYARCLLRDKRGFIWIGTYDGLNRYDGYKFRVFRNQPNDSGSLISPVIYALSEDQAGNIWVGTRQGLSIYNITTDRFSNLRVRGDQAIFKDVVRAIATDHQNNIFVGTENTGLLLCAGADHTASRVKLITGGGSTTSYSVQSLEVSAEGKVWAFVQNQGLFVYDRPSATLQFVDSTVKTAPALESSGNLIWIGSPDGLFEYNIADHTCVNRLSVQKGQLRSGKVNALTLDKSNHLWVGTIGGGISIWDRSSGAIEYLDAGDSRYSLSAVDINTILDDPESRKWIGTQQGGINIIDRQRSRFRTIAHDPAAPNKFKGNLVSAFYEAPGGKLWIGTGDAGVNVWDRNNNTFSNLTRKAGTGARLPSDYITYICGDGPDDIWLATFDAGIIRAQHDGKTIRTYKCINPSTGMEDPVVCVLYKDRSDTLWASTLRRGNRYAALYFYNRTADRFDAFDTRLSDLFIFTEDRNAQLWGGNLSQLVKIDRRQKKHSFYELGVAVHAIYEDRSGRFWVGTEGGLMLFDRKQEKVIAAFTTDQGLSNNSVLTINEDAQGALWISTFNGLCRFDPLTNTFRNYYHSDGLQSNQFNYNAALKLRSGELVLGGINGFNIFNPADIKPVNNTPPVVVTGVKVSNILVGAGSPYVAGNKATDSIMELRIPYDKAALTFDFAALEYSLPEKISYAYYLDGWDRNWNYSGALRTAVYTHLSEGSYTFRVKSSNAEGLWNGKETIVRVKVLPPWYRSWWAYLFYITTIGLLVVVWWRYRVKQAKLKYEIAIANFNIEKEKLEKDKQRAEYEKEKAVLEGERLLNEKEKESQKKQLDFFTSITHEFRSPLTLIINPAKDLVRKAETEGLAENRSELTAIFRNARRLISLVDQLLFFRKADTSLDKISVVNLNFYSLCYEIYLCFVQQAKTRNIQYEFIGNNPSLELYVDREKMEIVLFNLISNALKYTPNGGKIAVRILEEDKHVLLTVSDTGAGIPGSAGEKIFEKFYKAEREAGKGMPGFGIGLYLVRQIVTAHKGTVSYESEPGTGTTFRLELLKGQDHFSPEVIVRETVPQPLFLNELMEDVDADITGEKNGAPLRPVALEPVLNGRQLLLVVDDDPAIRRYIREIFQNRFSVYEAGGGSEGLTLAEKHMPDIIISDVKMAQGDGIDFCKAVKNHPSLGHIPVILLTGTHSSELKLEGIEGGADDYIMKPFDKELLQARVANLLKNKDNLQRFFFNEITLNKQDQKISGEYKEFLGRCIAIVERHLDDEEFSVLQLAAELDRSYSSVYKKIKLISGQTANGFIRFIRLRKAAELFINSNQNISEVAFEVGINDAKFFREQFSKLFGMKPSEYIKKYRKPFQDRFTISGDESK